jgi:DNA-binding transcriptional LysR family regulator
MVSGCSLPQFAELLAEFHRSYPGVAITLTEGPSDQLADSLRSGGLDLALIGAAGEPGPGLDSCVVLDDTLVALVGQPSALAGRSSLTVTGLCGEPLICLPRGTGIRDALDGACAASGFTPHVVFEASALAMVIQLACLGLGVGIVPASVVTTARPTARVVPITQPQVRSRLELAWATERATHPAARVLADHARRFAAGVADGAPATRRIG